jgi:hypothetical protein
MNPLIFTGPSKPLLVDWTVPLYNILKTRAVLDFR